MTAASAMHRKILVLNKSWVPINVYSLKRAITLLWKFKNGEPKAHIIDPTDNFRLYTWTDWEKLRPEPGEDVIKCISRMTKVPEIILLNTYDKMPAQTVKFSRRSIYKRDNFQCMYCGDRPGPELLNIDHVMPRAKGGLTTWENCVLSCFPCNTKKADRTLDEARMKLRKQPVKPKFSLFKNEKVKVLKSWESFVSQQYWDIELENDE